MKSLEQTSRRVRRNFLTRDWRYAAKFNISVIKKLRMGVRI